MFCQPLVGWRDVSVRARRTKIDWAFEMRRILNDHFAKAKKVVLVCDNLNTHVTGAFYDAFPAREARKLLDRLEIRHTPKHGSWLNVAENELSSMTRQSLNGHRFATINALQSQVKAWAKATNRKQRGVDWQFTVDDARQKLKQLYPKIKSG